MVMLFCLYPNGCTAAMLFCLYPIGGTVVLSCNAAVFYGAVYGTEIFMISRTFGLIHRTAQCAPIYCEVEYFDGCFIYSRSSIKK